MSVLSTIICSVEADKTFSFIVHIYPRNHYKLMLNNSLILFYDCIVSENCCGFWLCVSEPMSECLCLCTQCSILLSS